MEKQTTCSKCGSEKLMSGMDVKSYGDHSAQVGVFVTVDENPDAMFFKGQHQGSIRATVCGACGYAELYVDNARSLYSIYTESGQ